MTRGAQSAPGTASKDAAPTAGAALMESGIPPAPLHHPGRAGRRVPEAITSEHEAGRDLVTLPAAGIDLNA